MKIHIYSEDKNVVMPSCKVDKRVANTDPDRNTDPEKATCLGCLHRKAAIFKDPRALKRLIELKY